VVHRNKTALVTGLPVELDEPLRWRLLRRVAHVLVHYGRSAQEAESLVSEIQTKAKRKCNLRRI